MYNFNEDKNTLMFLWDLYKKWFFFDIKEIFKPPEANG